MTPGQRLSIGFGIAGYLTVTVLGAMLGGTQALKGVLIGSALAIFTIGSLTMLARAFLGRPVQRQAGMQRTLVVTALKLPISVALIFLGTRLSGPGIACFLASILLVYCSFIGFWSFSNA